MLHVLPFRPVGQSRPTSARGKRVAGGFHSFRRQPEKRGGRMKKRCPKTPILATSRAVSIPAKLSELLPSFDGDSGERARDMMSKMRTVMFRHEQLTALMEYLRLGDLPNTVPDHGQCNHPLVGSSRRTQECGSCRPFETTSNRAQR